jgi:hypothetical protein
MLRYVEKEINYVEVLVDSALSLLWGVFDALLKVMGIVMDERTFPEAEIRRFYLINKLLLRRADTTRLFPQSPQSFRQPNFESPVVSNL